jgi:hypothetical protein
MRATALLLILGLSAAGCVGTSSDPHSAKLNATEKMMWSTYPLGTVKGMATGFVVARRDARRPGVSVPVVVTAAHMLESVAKGPLVVALRVPDASGEPQIVVVPLPLRRTGAPFFVRHPRLDIGAFEPDLPSDLNGTVLPSFLEEKVVARGRGALRVGTEVSFLGYPDVLPGTSGGFPVLRSGKVASYPTAQLKAEGAFLINADVYPGDSGAPVFAAGRRGKPELVGMIVQRIGRTRGSFAHFAIAVDARAIRETLQLLARRDGQPRVAKQRPAQTR